LIDVIVTGSLVFVSEDEVIRDGYVYITNGVVRDFGAQPPPEDYTYASLVLGGQGRIVAPGLAAVADVASYVIRILRPSMADRVKFYKAMASRDLARAALAGVYELHLSGVTSIVVEGVGFELPGELRETAGGRYGLAYPACLGSPPSPPEWSLGVLRVSDESCPGDSDLVVRSGRAYTRRGDEVLSLFTEVAYTLVRIDKPWDYSLNLRRALGSNGQRIERGGRAEIVVFDSRRPPGMLLDYAKDLDLNRVFSSGLRVESVLVGDEVVVDGGEHLNIVEKHFGDIRRLASRIFTR